MRYGETDFWDEQPAKSKQQSNLDDKLREIKFTPETIAFPQDESKEKPYVLLSDEAIAQIKQCFADDNFVQLSPTHGWTVKQLKPYMTGQEWYDRLMTEVEKQGFRDGDDDGIWVAAAKRAAGLESEDD